ncbi:MAG: invasion associated locus B family protein [Pseudomonadota bacterium]
MFYQTRFALPLALSLVLGIAGPATAQQREVKTTHGDWQILCLSGTDQCAMQQIGNLSSGERALAVQITRVDARTEQGEVVPATVEIVAPLGVLLPAGVRVQVDGGKMRATGFEVCISNGCIAQDVMSDEFIGDMKRGSTAKMIIVLANKGESPIDISLKGFTRAFDSLTPLRPQTQ